MELIDIEIMLRLHSCPSPVTLAQVLAMFGGETQAMQNAILDAINRLAAPRLHMMDIRDGEIWLTKSGRVCARTLQAVVDPDFCPQALSS